MKSVDKPKADGTQAFMPIPKPPLPTLNSIPIQRAKFMNEMQAYMNQQACLAYGGAPPQAPSATFAHDVLKIKGDPPAKSGLVNPGVDAHTNTSYEQTLFPIGLATLKKFNESFSDISTAMPYSGDEMIFDDPSMMSRSPSSIANLVRNFEISVPGPSRGDRGSLMI